MKELVGVNAKQRAKKEIDAQDKTTDAVKKVREAVDKSDENEGVNDIKIRDDEMQSEGKCLNKKDDESGFFEEETVPNTSFVM